MGKQTVDVVNRCGKATPQLGQARGAARPRSSMRPRPSPLGLVVSWRHEGHTCHSNAQRRNPSS